MPAPPERPWKPLDPTEPAAGVLSFFLSDSLAKLPVRAITLPANNKSDPNLETATYGVFSTCSKQMRASAIRRRLRYVFFVTRRNGRRVVVGYYDLGWYCVGSFGEDAGDYCLAAAKTHFVGDPIPLEELESVDDQFCGSFRLMKLLSAPAATALKGSLDTQDNAIDAYLSEIDRLERFNHYHGGYRYVEWRQKEKFTWELADIYTQPILGAEHVSNVAPNDLWKCSGCRYELANKALLKRCPACGQLGTLKPAYA